MTGFAKRAAFVMTSGLAAMALGAAIASGSAAIAQVAGGSEHGVGAPLGVNGALLARPGPIELPRCIHRAADLRRGNGLADNRLTAWLTVKYPVLVVIKASGTASGADTGTIAITVIRDGVPVGDSPLTRGTDRISTSASASASLIPGRQYKFSAKAVVSDKRLDLFDMYVGVGKTCP